MAKGKIQSTVPVLYDAVDNKTGKLVIEMELIENDQNFTVISNRYAENNGVLTLIKTKTFSKDFAEVDALYASIKSRIDQNLPYSEKIQRERDLALLVYVQNDFLKDENNQTIEGKTLCNLDPDQWEIATSYERFAKKK